MNTRYAILLLAFFICHLFSLVSQAQPVLPSYNITWNSQSQNAAGSMPCGGGDIGLTWRIIRVYGSEWLL
jgi:hypothetical protein